MAMYSAIGTSPWALRALLVFIIVCIMYLLAAQTSPPVPGGTMSGGVDREWTASDDKEDKGGQGGIMLDSRLVRECGYERKHPVGRSKEAYGFLLTREGNSHYVYQGGAFMRQLREHDPARDIIIMYTDKVSPLYLQTMFSFIGVERIYFHPVHDLPTSQQAKTQKREKDKDVGRYGGMFSKLSVWSLVEYERILYMDFDMVWLSDKFLNLWNECNDKNAALCGIIDGNKDPYMKKIPKINGGILMVRPSLQVFAFMQQRVYEGWHVNDLFTEQSFMIFFFNQTEVPGGKQVIWDRRYNSMHLYHSEETLEESFISHSHVAVEDKGDKFLYDTVAKFIATIKPYFMPHFVSYVEKTNDIINGILCVLGTHEKRDKNNINEEAAKRYLIDFKKDGAGFCVWRREGMTETEIVLAEIRQTTMLRYMKVFYGDLSKFAKDGGFNKDNRPSMDFLSEPPKMCQKSVSVV
eukprot:Nk52_evm18s1916 gene=Nk52_evmTU18s1916